jgi:hypothetical protein
VERSGVVLDLTQALVAEEVVRIRAEGWSGVLVLTQGEVAKGLYFVDGAIAFAASTVEEDRLGACLFRAGRITQAQFHQAMREGETSGRPLGRTLVGMGSLTPRELAAAVATQVERIVLSVLRWTTGSLHREPMDRPLPADLTLDLDTPRLLLLGARQFPDTVRLERALGAPERRLRRVTPWPFDYEQVPSWASEREVLVRCARSVTVAELMALSHPRPQLARAIYALLVGGLLEDAPARVPAAVEEPSLEAVRAAPGPPLAVAAESVTPAPPPVLTAEEAESRARAFLEKGFRPRAIQVLEEALERHPEAPGPRRLLALTLSREGGFRPAVEKLFLSSLEKDPLDTELRYGLASYYRRAGMAARALLQLRLVVKGDSGHAAAWRDLGELEARESRRER